MIKKTQYFFFLRLGFEACIAVISFTPQSTNFGTFLHLSIIIYRNKKMNFTDLLIGVHYSSQPTLSTNVKKRSLMFSYVYYLKLY